MLFSEKVKETKLKALKNPSNNEGNNKTKKVEQKKTSVYSFSSLSSLYTEESSCSSIITNDLSLSLKSCSESLHFSSDRSFVDDKNIATSKPISSEPKTATGRTTFKKIIQEVHAGLEKITFRKKKVLKDDASNKSSNSDYYDCLEHISSIKIDENAEMKLSAPLNNFDRNSPDEVKGRSTEELNNLEDDMLNLSLEKVTTTSKKKTKNKPINKKLFDSLSKDKSNSTCINIVDSTPTDLQNNGKNPLLTSDSSAITIDNISPILRVSVAPLDNVYLDNDDFSPPKNLLKNKITEKNNDKCEIPDKIKSKALPEKEHETTVKPTKAKDNK